MAALFAAPLFVGGLAIAQETGDPMAGAGAMDDGSMGMEEMSPPVRAVQDVPPVLAGGLTVTPSGGDPFTASFMPDGTFETTAGTTGGWTMQNGYLCLSDASGELLCSIVDEAAEPGTSWDVTNPAGDVTTYAIPLTE